MDAIRARLQEMFSWDRISHYLVDDLMPDLVLALLVYGFFYLLWRALNGLTMAALRHSKLDETAQQFVRTVLKYGVLTVGLVSALSQIGVDTGALLASLGIAGLTIGFAARDTLSNLISGLFIFWDRPFVVGDLVEIGGQYGRVAEITLRSTRVVTVDGKMLAVPNTSVINSTVASYTNFPHLRLDVRATVGTGEDLGTIRRLLLELTGGDDRYQSAPAPEVVVVALHDYNVEIELRAWIVDERDHIRMRFELREKMFEALRAAGVDMPLETLALAPVEVRSSAG
jgi:small conductance mechanosensitive channel